MNLGWFILECCDCGRDIRWVPPEWLLTKQRCVDCQMEKFKGKLKELGKVETSNNRTATRRE